MFVESIVAEEIGEGLLAGFASVFLLVAFVASVVADAAFLLATSPDFASLAAEHRAFDIATRHATADQTHFQSAFDVARPSGGVRADEQQTNQHPRPSEHHRVGRFVDALFASARCSLRHFISVLFSFRISSSLLQSSSGERKGSISFSKRISRCFIQHFMKDSDANI